MVRNEQKSINCVITNSVRCIGKLKMPKVTLEGYQCSRCGKKWAVVFLSISIAFLLVLSSSGIAINAAQAYKLIVYLDGATGRHALDSFNLVVYNSEHKIILSKKITPNFKDNHYKISPKDGWSISDKKGQHPNQIKVCAHQTGFVNGEPMVHDDCFNIRQNNAKTYWYTIFDWRQFDEWEPD